MSVKYKIYKYGDIYHVKIKSFLFWSFISEVPNPFVDEDLSDKCKAVDRILNLASEVL